MRARREPDVLEDLARMRTALEAMARRRVQRPRREAEAVSQDDRRVRALEALDEATRAVFEGDDDAAFDAAARAAFTLREKRR